MPAVEPALEQPSTSAAAAPVSVAGLLPSVLKRVRRPETGLAIWQRATRLSLRVSALAFISRPPFYVTATGDPDVAAIGICHQLMLFQWQLYADFLRLARRLTSVAGSSSVRMRFEHVLSEPVCEFHVGAAKLRLLCTYAGPGTEWIDADNQVRRLASMEVGLFKGWAFPDNGPRVPHRSPSPSAGVSMGLTRLVLCIDTVP